MVHQAGIIISIGVMTELVFRQIQSKSLVQSKNFDNELIRSYFDPVLKKLRIIVHIQNHSSDEIEKILKQVEIEAGHTFAQQVGISLSGQLMLLKSQTTALVSTTAVLFLSSFGLLFSSFQHVFSLGVLIACASIAALMGDLIFMAGLV